MLIGHSKHVSLFSPKVFKMAATISYAFGEDYYANIMFYSTLYKVGILRVSEQQTN